MIELEPVAIITNDRLDPSDNFRGGFISTITLCENIPDEIFDGIDQFSHLEIIYYFHLSDPKAAVDFARHPRNNMSWPKVGLFAQRNKARPNRLGLCTVELIRREGRSLLVERLDAVDGTPVLDIKPVMREFQPQQPIKQPPWVSELLGDYWRARD